MNGIRSKSLAWILTLALIVTSGIFSTQPVKAAEAKRISAPEKVKVLAFGKQAIRVSWSKVKNADGYIVWEKAGSKKFKKAATLKSGKKIKWMHKKLKKNVTYQYKVRSYTIKKGKRTYSKFSDTVKAVTKSSKKDNVKRIRISAKNVKLEVGKTKKLKATLTPKKNRVASTVKWESSNTKVAKVKKGTITAIAPGKCTVTATAHNGRTAQCKIEVTAKEIPDPQQPETPQTPEDRVLMAEDIDNYLKYVDEDYVYQIAHTLAYDKAYFDHESGFRTSGSDAERAAAKFLEAEFKEIGMTNVERVELSDITKWQFNDASLTLENTELGINVKAQPYSFASTGGTLTTAPGSEYKIVPMGKGTEPDYEKYYEEQGLTTPEEKKEAMKHVIVLAEINSYAPPYPAATEEKDTNYWINYSYAEAHVQGAAGIITYTDQYVDITGDRGKEYNTAAQMQDICSRDFGIPCVAISKGEADQLKDAVAKIEEAEAEQQVTLHVDNEVTAKEGSETVIGMIEGTGNTGQQILFAGHYDKYFYGFQDDSLAVAIVCGVAKAMKDAGYQPYNDIVFIAHSSEECGKTGAECDWAMGSWELIQEGKPEWQGTTLGIFNYELPASYRTDGKTALTANLFSCEELSGFTKSFIDSNALPELAKNELTTSFGSQPMSDSISYQLHGVPHFQVNTNYGPGPANESDGFRDIYHTRFDNADTWVPEATLYNLEISGAWAIYLDQMPALDLDFGMRCEELENTIVDAGIYEAADADIEAYKAAVAEFKEISKAYTANIRDINVRYEAAIKANNAAEAEKIRKEALEQNKKSLEIYRFLQDEFIGFTTSYEVVLHHEAIQRSIQLIGNAVAALESGDIETAKNNLCGLNGSVEQSSFEFSKETCKIINDTVYGVYESDTWTGGNWNNSDTNPALGDAYEGTTQYNETNMKGWVRIYETTHSIANPCGDNYNGKTDAKYTAAIAAYNAEIERLNPILKQQLERETNALGTMAEMMK